MRYLLLLLLACSTPAPVVTQDRPYAVGSAEGCPAPELASTGDSVTLQPTSYTSWTAMFSAHPNREDYLLSPGDYTSWGILRVKNKVGLPTRRRTVRGLPGGEVRVASIEVRENASYWVLTDLAVRYPSTESYIGYGAHHVLLQRFILDGPSRYGVRVVGASDVCIQESEFTNAVLNPGDDTSGIQVKPINQDVNNIDIINNEFRDLVDGVAVTDHPSHYQVHDLRIEGNRITQTNLMYTHDGMGCGENGIDIKAGSDTQQLLIRDNWITGMRYTDVECSGTGSTGDAILVHNEGRNVLIDHNLIWDVPTGVRDKVWLVAPNTWASRNITISDNGFFEVRHYNENDYGAILHPSTDLNVVNNYFADSDLLCSEHLPDPGYQPGPPSFEGNQLVNTGWGSNPCAY